MTTWTISEERRRKNKGQTIRKTSFCEESSNSSSIFRWLFALPFVFGSVFVSARLVALTSVSTVPFCAPCVIIDAILSISRD